MIDYVHSDNPNDRFLVLSDFKSVQTDSTGLAVFKTLGVMDVESYTCIAFQFLVGSPEQSIQSSKSNRLCFMADTSIVLQMDETAAL
jgi:hypothetical protein